MNVAADTAVVVVHGFKGARLAAATTDRLVWLTAKEALFGNRPLTLADPDLGLENELILRSDGILESVPVVPGLFGVQVYGKLLLHAQHQAGPRSKVVPFAYDWRRDPVSVAQDLAVLLEQLRKAGVRQFELIAHSYGALVTAWYLRYGAQTPEAIEQEWAGCAGVRRVVFIAGAFQGTTKMFRVMQLGDPVGRNTALLSAEALSSFPASYFLLPAQTRYVIDGQGQLIADDPGLAEIWLKHGWGLFQGPAVSLKKEARLAFAARQLGAQKMFMEKLHAPTATPPPDHLQVKNIQGKGRRTLDRVILDEDAGLVLNAKMRGKHPHLQNVSIGADGDGTITVAASRLPDAFAVQRNTEQIMVDAEHMAIVQDPGALKLI